MVEDIAPLTPRTAGLRRRCYIHALLGRFANRSLQHRTLQIAMDGSQKIPVRWLPVLREARQRGLPVPHLVTALAAWLRFLAGRDEAGQELPLDDPLAARLRATVIPVADDPVALVRAALGIEEVFGPDLRQDAVLADQLTAVLTRIVQAGRAPPCQIDRPSRTLTRRPSRWPKLATLLSRSPVSPATCWRRPGWNVRRRRPWLACWC